MRSSSARRRLWLLRDVVLGISTSGNSNNVFHALTAANAAGCGTISLLGRDGGNIAGIVDLAVTVAVRQMPLIQAAYEAIVHMICDLVEKEPFATS